MWCARPDDMQRAANRRSSAVLKLGRYIVRCLTAQPDIWFLFLYKCGQLVAVNLHEPVARSVGILDELFQAQQPSHERPRRPSCPAIGSLPSTQRPRAATAGAGAGGAAASPAAAAEPEPRDARPPDNDQNRGMEDEDDVAADDGYTDSDDDPYVFLTGRRFTYGSSCGSSSRRTSSSGCGRSYSSGTNSRRNSLVYRRESCTSVGTGTGNITTAAAIAAGTYPLRLPPLSFSSPSFTFLSSAPHVAIRRAAATTALQLLARPKSKILPLRSETLNLCTYIFYTYVNISTNVLLIVYRLNPKCYQSPCYYIAAR